MLPTLLEILLGILVVLLITALTGYFVAQEFGYMAVDRSRLKARAADGDVGARRALDITRRTSFMLSGAQLGITVTGLLVVVVDQGDDVAVYGGPVSSFYAFERPVTERMTDEQWEVMKQHPVPHPRVSPRSAISSPARQRLACRCRPKFRAISTGCQPVLI